MKGAMGALLADGSVPVRLMAGVYWPDCPIVAADFSATPLAVLGDGLARRTGPLF